MRLLSLNRHFSSPVRTAKATQTSGFCHFRRRAGKGGMQKLDQAEKLGSGPKSVD